jgi:hypothetical protein
MDISDKKKVQAPPRQDTQYLIAWSILGTCKSCTLSYHDRYYPEIHRGIIVELGE